MKTNLILPAAIFIAHLVFVSGCTTTDMQKTLCRVTGQASFEPSTYGTAALFATIENVDSSRADAMTAAQELSNRQLTNEDGHRLASALKKRPDEEIQLAILATVESQDMDFLLEDLVAFFPQASFDDSAAKIASLIASYMSDDERLFQLISAQAIESNHANVRARSAKFLSSYGTDAVPALLKAMKSETSASAAMAMITGLRDFGGQDGYNVLQEVQNDVTRKYKTDAYLGEKVTAEMVRATAVEAVEDMRRNH